MENKEEEMVRKVGEGLVYTFLYSTHYIAKQNICFTYNIMQLETKHKKIESIRFKLWSIHKLHPTAIYNALLELITLHQPQTFIPMMRECIKASKHDPHLGKYIHLFDILLNHCIFNHLLHGCLVEFYSKIVQHLNMQKLRPWIEQAMILRKYWLRRIHHKLYEELRVQTYRLTCIDVDNILSREAIQQIRCYYVEKLQLTKQELFYYLPQLHQLYPAYYYTYNHTHHIQDIQGMINQADPPHKQLLLAKQPKVLQLSDVDNTVEPAQVGHCVQSNAINFITNPYDTNVNNCFYKLPEPRSHNFDFAKRPRTDSEETHTDQKIEIVSKCRINVNDQLVYFQKKRVLDRSKVAKENAFQSSPIKEKLQCSPLKQETVLVTPPKQKYFQPPQKQKELQSIKYPTINQQPKTQSHIKIQQMMNKLLMLNNYECKECGMRFATETSRKQHTEQHIKYKLKQLDLLQARKYGSIIKNPSKLKTAALWINPKAEEEEELSCHIVLPQKQADLHQNHPRSQEDSNSKTRTQEETQIEQQQPISVQKQQICPLCCLSFQETMMDNQWVIKNAIRINLTPTNINPPHNPKLMHLQCSKILLQSQKSNPLPSHD